MFFSHKVKKSHVAIWNWIQKHKHQRISSKRNKISEYIVDETILKAGSGYIWLWVAIEQENRQILALFYLRISKERNMFVAERFLSTLVKIHRRHPISTDGGTWYPQACRFLKIRHYIHSPLEKRLIEKEPCNILMTGLKVSMITFHVEKQTVNSII